jgi:hypothetical protein
VLATFAISTTFAFAFACCASRFQGFKVFKASKTKRHFETLKRSKL